MGISFNPFNPFNSPDLRRMRSLEIQVLRAGMQLLRSRLENAKTIPKPKHFDRSGNTCVCSDKSVKAFGIFDVFVSAVRALVFSLPSEGTKGQISAWPGLITTAQSQHPNAILVTVLLCLTSYHTLCCSWAQPPEGLRQETVDKTWGEKICRDKFGYTRLPF